MSRKRIALIGATGSIGDSTLRVLRTFPEDFELIGAAANCNVAELQGITKEFNPKRVTLYNEEAYEKFPKGAYEIGCGKEGLFSIVEDPEVDLVVMAMLGSAGLEVMLRAIDAGKTIALASKEIMVMGGELIMKKARERGVTILPLDSEHSALFQCLVGENKASIERMILTASGGAFRGYSLEQLANVKPEDALNHPTWDMGRKVTLDCATLANKGLELIEARWLFEIEPTKLSVMIHPQSIIHSMVQFRDGSMKAQLSDPKMTYPIQYALHYPERKDSCEGYFDFTKAYNLELYPPSFEKHPCLRLAVEALGAGGCATTIFNAANEVAGEAFLNGKIGFLKIAEIIDNTLEEVSNKDSSDLYTIMCIDAEAREVSENLVNEFRYI